jgi:hypothetical protein
VEDEVEDEEENENEEDDKIKWLVVVREMHRVRRLAERRCDASVRLLHVEGSFKRSNKKANKQKFCFENDDCSTVEYLAVVCGLNGTLLT